MRLILALLLFPLSALATKVEVTVRNPDAEIKTYEFRRDGKNEPNFLKLAGAKTTCAVSFGDLLPNDDGTHGYYSEITCSPKDDKTFVMLGTRTICEPGATPVMMLLLEQPQKSKKPSERKTWSMTAKCQ